MNIKKDYYAILGVLPSVDSAVLSAVYRALLKKYHPDVYSGLKADAERITKEINEAYGILSDATKRRQYDEKRESAQERSGNYEAESDIGGTDGNSIDETLNGNWDYIVRYRPDAELFRLELSKLSPSLAFAYQVILIETQLSTRAAEIKAELQQQFLERYFGSNEMIHAFVLNAIQAQRRDVAAEVNRAIKILGSPTSEEAAQFITTVRKVTGWSDHGFKSAFERGGSHFFKAGFEFSDAAVRRKSPEADASANELKQRGVDDFPLTGVMVIAIMIAVGFLLLITRR